jgi:hypothetical protein
MGSAQLSQETLEEWREHPVTRAVLASLKRCLAMEEASLTHAYWTGGAVRDPQALEVRRLAFRHKQDLVEDLSEASAEDFISMMETEQ